MSPQYAPSEPPEWTWPDAYEEDEPVTMPVVCSTCRRPLANPDEASVCNHCRPDSKGRLVGELAELMCPHCGWRYDASEGPHVPAHERAAPHRRYPTDVDLPSGQCPGSNHTAWNPLRDRRRLWEEVPPTESKTRSDWRAVADGTGYRIENSAGEVRARFKDAEVMAEHLAMMMQREAGSVPGAWPDAKLEAEMIADADICRGPHVMLENANDCACHVRALLSRVRELEQALRYAADCPSLAMVMDTARGAGVIQ